MPSTSDDERLVDALGQAAFTTMGTLSDLAAEAGISLTQLRVVAILRDRRLRMSDLARYLGLQRSTMSGLVTRGERRGLLRRTPNEDDARAIDVLLTPQGHELAAKLEASLHETLRPVIETLPPGDRRTLAELLVRMLP
ncbi:MarR family transcriptional regulator [Pseudoclavibacter chungangensis]|uniref:MarR family transcriptional regulator n=1 Tax=Pseudoclavibacter chungangensis TaxID=587635 RepID=A0A7J5C343_9MICO|nr:MarR family transcriptional regulator [Pseudoclavibacter chungangensis]KAB1662188.1 MarR family transcriptional regulator [Pseudoclavibacter chungangensis]NYJ65378.1 DNA-binding MarR family transcriptional regulator [Pseudoclavibacter chungangensis]